MINVYTARMLAKWGYIDALTDASMPYTFRDDAYAMSDLIAICKLLHRGSLDVLVRLCIAAERACGEERLRRAFQRAYVRALLAKLDLRLEQHETIGVLCRQDRWQELTLYLARLDLLGAHGLTAKHSIENLWKGNGFNSNWFQSIDKADIEQILLEWTPPQALREPIVSESESEDRECYRDVY